MLGHRITEKGGSGHIARTIERGAAAINVSAVADKGAVCNVGCRPTYNDAATTRGEIVRKAGIGDVGQAGDIRPTAFQT